jgi:hypothetical protein
MHKISMAERKIGIPMAIKKSQQLSFLFVVPNFLA